MDYVLFSMFITYPVMVQQDGYIDSLFLIILVMVKHKIKEYEYAIFRDKEKVIDKSFGFDIAVEEAQRAINATQVEAESVENGVGVVKLMGYYSGLFCKTSEDGHFCNFSLFFNGLKYGTSSNLTLIFILVDPTYMIRAISSNASDNVYCSLLAHSAIHGAMAGFWPTSTTSQVELLEKWGTLPARILIYLRYQQRWAEMMAPIFSREAWRCMWYMIQLTRIERTCAMAELFVLRLMLEPTAVALLYGQHQQQTVHDNMGSRSENIAMIFNMGAGYCDVCVTATTGGVLQIKALLGSHIGGEDIVQNIMHHLLPNMDSLFLSHINNEMKAMGLLRVTTQDAVIKLSS
ncbi:hypothetical protein GIB67_032087 [Kingdonia uniflora]|uniref:Uncharacterized protein n=1 Tax=Kingdonia uniflora TaxID=39325 RepID=A0A7J7MWR0_9MAGN|nr:hypothetical protein GIB67_032087 [Kingdonia uniflora]